MDGTCLNLRTMIRHCILLHFLLPLATALFYSSFFFFTQKKSYVCNFETNALSSFLNPPTATVRALRFGLQMSSSGKNPATGRITGTKMRSESKTFKRIGSLPSLLPYATDRAALLRPTVPLVRPRALRNLVAAYEDESRRFCDVSDGADDIVLRLAAFLSRVGMTKKRFSDLTNARPRLMGRMLAPCADEEDDWRVRSTEEVVGRYVCNVRRIDAYRGDVVCRLRFLSLLMGGKDGGEGLSILLKRRGGWILLSTLSVSNARKTVERLRSEGGLAAKDVRAMVAACPSLLDLSADNMISPCLSFLRSLSSTPRDECDDEAEFLRRVLTGTPKILTCSTPDNLIPTASFLSNALDLVDGDLRTIVRKSASILLLSVINNLGPKLTFFQYTMGLSKSDLRRAVMTTPSLLALSLDLNIVPTTEYYVDGAGMKMEALRDAVAEWPAVLGYSLEQRIKPRVERMKERGIQLGLVVGGPAMVMGMSEDKFGIW